MTRSIFYSTDTIFPGDFTVRQRVESAIAHHEYESKNYSANYEKLVYRAEGIRLWEQKIGDRHFSITLTGSEHNRHEGDLSVVLSYDDINLWRISFSYVRGEIFNLGRRDFLFLTRNQAEASDRRIFQECFGQNQPQLFCLSAVCGIVMANGWDSLLAIRHDDQIAYEKTLNSGFYNSYNALWKQFSAREIDGRVFEMAAPLNLRPLTEVSRSHRGRARGRRQIWDRHLARRAGDARRLSPAPAFQIREIIRELPCRVTEFPKVSA